MKPTSAHSFRGAKVVGWQVSDQLFELETSDVIFEGHSCGPAKLIFPLVHPATAMSYDFKLNQWLPEPQIEKLKEIREFHHKCGKVYSLKGYGAESGKFLAVAILSEEAQITWENGA